MRAVAVSLPACYARLSTNHIGVQLIGVANETQRLQCSLALSNNSKLNEAIFSTVSISSCTYRPLRCQDLDIWRFCGDDEIDDKQNQVLYISQCMCFLLMHTAA